MRLWVIIFAEVLSAANCWADEPLPAPSSKTICNDKVCVTSDPAAKKTITLPKGSKKPAWVVDQFFRDFQLSEDGVSFVGLYGGQNLAPKDNPGETVMLTFFSYGQKRREYRLKEIIKDVSTLQRTVSHRVWGSFRAKEVSDLIALDTVEGQVCFSLISAKRVDCANPEDPVLHFDKLPDELEYLNYNGGNIAVRKKIKRGEKAFQELEELLKRESFSGWKLDLTDYAPSTLYSAKDIMINCSAVSLIVNYREAKEDKELTQKKKKIANNVCPGVAK